MPQKKYWQELYDLKAHSNYVGVYRHKTEVIDRGTKMFLAIASSASIGAWVIWQKYSFVWASIIALSQVVNALKPFLPYKSRLKALNGLSHDLEELCIQVEMRWYDVSGGHITAEEINKLQYDFRLKKLKAYKKHLGDFVLPHNPAYLKTAEDRASQHFTNYYREVAIA